MIPNKPNLLCIGAQKAGSTWVQNIMRLHPQIVTPSVVESLFFNNTKNLNKKDFAAYVASFKIKPGQKDFDKLYFGEKTPSYFWTKDETSEFCNPPANHNNNIPLSVKEYLGKNTKLIVSLRHPVLRAISAFHHHKRRDRINSNESLLSRAKDFGIVDIGFYERHLSQWLREFDNKNILVLIQEEDISNDPEKGYNKICSFLDIDPNKLDVLSLRKKINKGISLSIENLENNLNRIDKLNITKSDLSFLNSIYSKTLKELEKRFAIAPIIWKSITHRIDNIISSENHVGHLFINKNKNLTFNSSLKKHGIAADFQIKQKRALNTIFEAPCNTASSMFFGNNKVGAFTYLETGWFFDTIIGRYCSIGPNLVCGQGDHPYNGMSTHPIFYQKMKYSYGIDLLQREKLESYNASLKSREYVRSNVSKKQTIIGNDVWVGNGVFIKKGVNIGNGAIIGAKSVVTKDIPPYAIVAGTPAKIIKYRFDNQNIIKQLLELAWWEYHPDSLSELDIFNINVCIDQLTKLRQNNTPTYFPDIIKIT